MLPGRAVMLPARVVMRQAGAVVRQAGALVLPERAVMLRVRSYRLASTRSSRGGGPAVPPSVAVPSGGSPPSAPTGCRAPGVVEEEAPWSAECVPHHARSVPGVALDIFGEERRSPWRSRPAVPPPSAGTGRRALGVVEVADLGRPQPGSFLWGRSGRPIPTRVGDHAPRREHDHDLHARAEPRGRGVTSPLDGPE
jgi:hypothetical protein